MALRRDDASAVLFGRVTLVAFAVIGALVALAEWGLVPRESLLVGAPAIAAALLLDTFLYNEFLLGTPTWFLWAEIYAFLYVEAAVVGAVVHRIRPDWPSGTTTRE